MLSNDLVDLRLCTNLNLNLSLVNVPNLVLELVLHSSVPEYTAEIGGVVVVEFIKDHVKLVIDIGSKNEKVNQKACENITHTKDASISVINAHIGPLEVQECRLDKLNLCPAPLFILCIMVLTTPHY